jgi:Flp pilus assembly protein TadD
MDKVRSVPELKQILDQNPNDLDAALTLGNYHYDRGDAGLAVLYYRHVLDLDSSLSGVRTDMGAMYWRNENVGLAEQAFRQTIERDASFGQAYINLGMLLQHAKGNISEARSIWQALLDVEPEHEIAGKARELLLETATLIN